MPSIPKVEIGGLTVSSTYIRRLLELGQTERAARFLGHPHTLTGAVRHGRGVGSSRLFPTANLVIPPHVLVPSYGVYVTRVYLPNGEHYAAVTNVGTRPTLDNGADVTVEACLLDFQGDLYGQTLRLEFYRHLRDEMRFDSLDALRTRIAADVIRGAYTALPEKIVQTWPRVLPSARSSEIFVFGLDAVCYSPENMICQSISHRETPAEKQLSFRRVFTFLWCVPQGHGLFFSYSAAGSSRKGPFQPVSGAVSSGRNSWTRFSVTDSAWSTRLERIPACPGSVTA